MSTDLIDLTPEPALKPISMPTPKPGPTKLRLVPPKPLKRGPLEVLSPREQVQLHPKGCNCSYHRPNSPWGIPRGLKPGKALLAGPKVVVWDIENWHGTPLADPLAMAQEFRFTRGVLGLTRDDYIILGMSHFTADRCSFALPTNSTALVFGSGPDGADKALINAIDVARLAKCFKSLVVISGDHIFTSLTREAKREGMTTWNVSTDLSDVAIETRRAYDGWTHLKLQAFRNKVKASEEARKTRRGELPPAT